MRKTKVVGSLIVEW